MQLIDWILFFIPIAAVIFVAIKAQKYVHGVADFLSAGRVARRYVLTVASGQAGMGLITLVGMFEAYYASGFGYSFWQSITMPIGLALALFGFCNYRFRETRAMTMGQFFEIRYNRAFRSTASIIQGLYGVLNYGIFPAVGARFLIYFLGFPTHVSIFGYQIPTLAIVMFIALGLACWISCAGGQVTIMVTDCMQGILGYPIYVIIVIYLICRFSWSEEMLPTLMARAPGFSMLNPYDTDKLRDFNIFYVFSGIIGMFLLRLSWGGRGYDSAAKNAHEAKMGGLLANWRDSFANLMYVLLAITAFTFFNHKNYAEQSAAANAYLAKETLSDILADGGNEDQSFAQIRETLPKVYEELAPRTEFRSSYNSEEEYEAENENPYLAKTKEVLGQWDKDHERVDNDGNVEVSTLGAKRYQTFESIFKQMRIAAAFRHILPTGLLGLFCVVMVFLMVSTDTTYLHAWASTIVQDIILPFRKKPFEPHQQIKYLRVGIVGVALFGFLFSLFFGQVDYVLMFFAITGALWTASGPVITLGLYWKRGTTVAAFVSLIVGAFVSVCAILAQKMWVSHIYVWLDAHNYVQVLDSILQKLSSPFGSYVMWKMDPDKFPINSVEIGFMVQLFTLLLYVVVSLLTCKEPFNMDRMLHRGKWADADSPVKDVRIPIMQRILGIDSNYTRGDRILAWSVFVWQIVLHFGILFLGVLIWHYLAGKGWVPKIPVEWWGDYFYFKTVILSILVGTVSTFWFGFCSSRDLWRLFRDLAGRTTEVNRLDDGRVEGNVNLADKQQ